MDESLASSIEAFFKSNGLTYKPQISDVNAGYVQLSVDEFRGVIVITSHAWGFEAGIRDYRVSSKIIWEKFGGEALTKEQLKLQRDNRKAAEELMDETQLGVKGLIQIKLNEWRELRGESLYLKAKSLPTPDTAIVRPDENTNRRVLVLPMVDGAGEVWNVQQIWPHGEKPFWPGGRTKGLFSVIPGANGPSRVLVGEGYATCLAANLASGLTCYCAFSSANMEAVVRLMLERYRPEQIVLLVDWDAGTELKTGVNTGLQTCVGLAMKYRVGFALPLKHAGSLPLDQNVDCADVWAISPSDLTLALKDDYIRPWEMAADFYKAPPKLEKPVEVLEPTVEEPVVVLEATLPVVVDFLPPAPAQTFEPSAEQFPTKADGFHFEVRTKQSSTWKPHYYEFAGYVTQKYFMKGTEGVLYGYVDGAYEAWSTLKLKHLAMRICRENTAPGVLNGMAEMVENNAYTPADQMITPAGFINLQNGVLNVRTRQLEPHSPARFFKYKLPHAFDPNALCPNWEKFLTDTFEGNQELSDLSGEVFGWVLMGGAPQIHKAIFLQGEGRNGKGVWLDTLKGMIGELNWSSVPLDKLDEPFRVVQANGKLANIVTEVTTAAIQSDAFKTAVSGESMSASFKHKDLFKFDFHARIILAANKTPFMNDTTTGTHEKFLIIPFNRYIQKQDRELNFVGKHILPEMPGIMNWALRGLDRLIKRGGFLESEAVDASVDEMRKEIDPTYQWFCERVRIGVRDAKATYPGLAFSRYYDNYVTWSQSEGYQPIKRLTFVKKCMAEVRKNPNLSIGHPNNVTTVYGNIKVLSKSDT